MLASWSSLANLQHITVIIEVYCPSFSTGTTKSTQGPKKNFFNMNSAIITHTNIDIILNSLFYFMMQIKGPFIAQQKKEEELKSFFYRPRWIQNLFVQGPTPRSIWQWESLYMNDFPFLQKVDSVLAICPGLTIGNFWKK